MAEAQWYLGYLRPPLCSSASHRPCDSGDRLERVLTILQHCGAIRYKMKLSPPLYEEQCEGGEQYPVTSCNCSHCERQGVLAVHPLIENLEFTQGKEELEAYRTASKMNPHFSCPKCHCFVGTDLDYMMREVFKGPVRWTVNVSLYLLL
jgi:hypothetical protein